MDNVLEIIIRVVDQASAGLDPVKKKTEDLGKQAGLTRREFDRMLRSVVAVGAGFVAAIRAIQGFRNEAERLGRTDVVNNIDRMNEALQQTADVLLSLKLFGDKSVADIIGDAAKSAGDLAKIASITQIQDRLKRIDEELNGRKIIGTTGGAPIYANTTISDERRNELLKEQIALRKQLQDVANGENTHNKDRISLEALADSVRILHLKQMVQLTNDMVAANDRLLQNQHDMNDAIRAGDARRLADLQFSAAMSRPTDPSNFLASTRNQRPRGQATPDNPAFMNGVGSGNVNVYIDGVQVHVKSTVRETLAKEVFVPAAGTGSSGRRH